MEGRSADDGLRLGPQQTAHQKDLAALLGQQTGVSDAVGDVPGVQRRAAQLPDQRQRGAAGVQKDEILCGDEGRCRLCDALFLDDSQRFLRCHRRLVGEELAVRQGRAAVYLVHLAHPVQLVQIAADGGLAGIQRLAELLHRRGALLAQQLHDAGKPLLCQHLHPSCCTFLLVFESF